MYMKQISTKELMKLQLDILISVDDFCTRNGIQYSLGYGTLIGAIRHKGYIPWDDDIDIVMTRGNYDKFINSFNGFSDKLYVVAPELNWNYYAPYANVCDNRTILYEGDNGHNGIEVGVKIDIFPIDATSSDDIDNKRVKNRILRLNNILRAKRYCLGNLNTRAKLRLLAYRFLFYFRSYSSVQKKIRILALSYRDTEYEYVDNLVFYPKTIQTPKSYFDKYIDVDVEGYKFKSIKNYDIYLRQIYGDYMKLPPIEQRVPHHGFTAYWKD